MEEMAVEEQEAMEECKAAEKQRVRWADMEDGQTEEKEEEVGSWEKGQEEGSETETERLMGQDTAAEEDRPEVERGAKREEEKQETAEERGRMKKLWGGIRQKFTKRWVGIAWRKKRMDSSGGKNGSGRAFVGRVRIHGQ